MRRRVKKLDKGASGYLGMTSGSYGAEVMAFSGLLTSLREADSTAISGADVEPVAYKIARAGAVAVGRGSRTCW